MLNTMENCYLGVQCLFHLFICLYFYFCLFIHSFFGFYHSFYLRAFCGLNADSLQEYPFTFCAAFQRPSEGAPPFESLDNCSSLLRAVASCGLLNRCTIAFTARPGSGFCGRACRGLGIGRPPLGPSYVLSPPSTPSASSQFPLLLLPLFSCTFAPYIRVVVSAFSRYTWPCKGEQPSREA